MKNRAYLIIESFRRSELNLLIRFFLKLKKIFLRNIFIELSLVKVSLIFKFSFHLFANNIINEYVYKKIYHLILNDNYFYCTNKNNIDPITNASYYLDKGSNKFKTLNYILFSYQFIRFIYSTFEYNNRHSYSSMPTTRKHITLLRSPHTDKKSREQFVLKKYKKIIVDNHNFFSLITKVTSLLNLRTFMIKEKLYKFL